MDKTEEELKSWFEDDSQGRDAQVEKANEEAVDAVLVRARRSVAQKDTMDLVFVKIWTAMFELLAPLFASGLRKKNHIQAELGGRKPQPPHTHERKKGKQQ